MITTLSQIWTDVERVALAAGARRVGAAALRGEHAAEFVQWIAAGHHASMTYLEKNQPVREDPQSRFPWAKSAIVILVPYASERPAAPPGTLAPAVARYALGDDYHLVLDKMLRQIEKAVPGRSWRYVDTGPLSDRALAAAAGLGWIGRNSMLIHEQDGSYCFIGVLLTSLENDLAAEEVADRCGSCIRCVEACPTHAILPNRTVASERCISYATIEHRGALPEDVAQHLSGNAFGCDICQEVCPWNGAPPPSHPAFEAREAYRSTPLRDLLRYAQADFSALFRRSAIKRARLEGMQRNVEALLRRQGEGASHDARID